MEAGRVEAVVRVSDTRGLPGARGREQVLLNRCVNAVSGRTKAASLEEASVFAFVGGALRSAAPVAARRLSEAAAVFFADHGGVALTGSELVRRDVLFGLPRFRDALARRVSA